MAITKILPEDYANKGVIGLPDAPELSTLEMQEAFDEIAIEVIIPHINGMADEIDDADEALSTAISNEVTRATGAENTLSGRITAEVTRATGAEGDLEDAIAAEVTRASGIEGMLSGRITAEVQRATAAEAELSEAISSGVNTLGLSVVAGKLCATYNT